MNRLIRFWRSNYVTPLSKSINTRHLALEPLCCIQSCRIRSGCHAVAIFETIGIVCISAYAISQLQYAYSIPHNFYTIRSYDDFSKHPSSYILIIGICFLCFLFIGLFLFGVRRFHARLVQMHLLVQLAICIIAILLTVAIAVQLGLQNRRNKHIDDNTQNGLMSTTQGSSKKSEPKISIHQIGMLTCAVYLLIVEIWGITVVYDCYKYFKLCQVLVNLASTHRRPTTHAIDGKKNKAKSDDSVPSNHASVQDVV